MSSLKEQIGVINSAAQEELKGKNLENEEINKQLVSLISQQSEEKLAWKERLQDLAAQLQDKEALLLVAQKTEKIMREQVDKELQSKEYLERSLSELNEKLDKEKERFEQGLENANLQQATNKNLLEKIHSLENDMESLEVAVKAKEEELNARNAVINEIKESLFSKDKKIEEQSREADNLSKKLFTIKQELQKEKENREREDDTFTRRLNESISDYEKTIERQNLSISSLQERNRSLEAEIKEKNKEVQDYKTSQQTKSSKELEESKILQVSLRSTIEELSKALQHSTHELEDFRRDNQVLNANILKKDEATADLLKENEQLLALQSHMAILKQHLTEKERDLNDARSKLIKIQEDQASCSSKVEKNEAELKRFKKSSASWQEKFAEVNLEKEEFEAKLLEVNQEKSDLKKEVTDLNFQNSSLKSELDEKSNEVEVKYETLKETSAELAKTQTLVERLQEALQGLSGECETINVKNSELERSNLSKDEKIQDLNSQLTDKDAELEAGLLRLMNEVKARDEAAVRAEETQTAICEMKQQISDLSRICSKNEDEKAGNAQKIKELEDELRQTKLDGNAKVLLVCCNA